MKTTPFARMSVIAALALAPFVAGCGATDEDVEAQYPQNPAVGSSDESLSGLPPGAAVNSQGDINAADDAYARGFAAGQQAGQNPGNVDGTVVIGDTGSEYSDTDPSALTDFRSTLDPYGSWVDDETYGTVWYPSATVVGGDFQPYVTAGHWVYDDDYVWVSDYDWGWVPFHYGRWILTPHGWAWIPGRVYSGAWVTWRMGYGGYGYLGWAPLAPTWYWRGGYAYSLYYAPPAPYAYCPNEHVFEPGGPRGYIAGGSLAATAAANTRPYVPASPSVNGHVGATPSVNGVTGVSSRGPAPAALGLSAAQVPHSNGSNVGLARAKGFASPRSAQTFGAHAPSGYANPGSHGAVSSRSSLAPIATGPRYIGGPTAGPTHVPWNAPSPAERSTQTFSRPSGGVSQPSTFQGRSFDTHTFSSHPSAFSNSQSSGFTSSAPRSSPSFSSGFSPHSSFSSSPSFHSASPSFHAPAAPAYHPSSHPSFSGGGHVGGGHAGHR